MQWCRGQLHDSSTVCTEEAGRITTRISQVTQILLAMGGIEVAEPHVLLLIAPLFYAWSLSRKARETRA